MRHRYRYFSFFKEDHNMVKVIKGRSMAEALGLFQDIVTFGCSPNGPGCSSYSCVGCSRLNRPNG
jgi:pentatricopeptide repeat protein